MPIRGALLDIDGTLLDSNDAHAAAYVAAGAAERVEIAFERVRPLIGMGSDHLLPELGIQPDSPAAKRIGARKKAVFTADYLPRLRPCRGARNLLQVMKSRGLSLTVATSAKAEELHDLLRVAGIADLDRDADDLERRRVVEAGAGYRRGGGRADQVGGPRPGDAR